MSKITFFPLGGMDENEKACYVLEIDGKYYLINLGISVPVYKTLGIKKVIPYMEWVKKNEKLIEGIFIGNASYRNIGAIQYCYNYIKNIPIYTSKLGATILKAHFNKKSMQKHPDFKNLKIEVLEPLKPFNLGKIKITPFRVTTSLPDSFGFIISANNENIIYIDEFVVSSGKNSAFLSDIDKLPMLTYKQNNLLLINNVGNADKNSGFTAPNYQTKDFYNDIITTGNDKRLIVACYYHDIHTFLTLAQIAKERQIPFIVYNPIFINVFNEIVSNKYFDSSNLLMLPINKINEIEKGIVVVSSTPDRLFSKLLSISNDQDDILALKKSDTVVLGFKVESGFEKAHAEILDAYAQIHIDIRSLPKTILSIEASQEDHKFLTYLVKPKYIIPTLAQYYQMVKYRNCLTQIGFHPDNVITMYNGEIATFNNGTYVPSKKRVDIHEMYVGSQGILTEGANIFQERRIMSESGIVFCAIKYDEKNKTIDKNNFEILPYAVLPEEKETKAFFENLKEEAYTCATNAIKKMNNNDFKELKSIVKKFISKQIDKTYEKSPIVIVSIC
ncbi:MAG: ribonuclease J [Malacoplasma sp.]|nr:ribonuclease J [Malacoplasma sp.]